MEAKLNLRKMSANDQSFSFIAQLPFELKFIFITIYSVATEIS